mmetsp:Transcript_42411/g.111749  ORF Transcript_42411/g.111749 Transcript_42411/m.111749 type:complete len:289 (+) Transcript_42411:253-1119(+)
MMVSACPNFTSTVRVPPSSVTSTSMLFVLYLAISICGPIRKADLASCCMISRLGEYPSRTRTHSLIVAITSASLGDFLTSAATQALNLSSAISGNCSFRHLDCISRNFSMLIPSSAATSIPGSAGAAGTAVAISALESVVAEANKASLLCMLLMCFWAFSPTIREMLTVPAWEASSKAAIACCTASRARVSNLFFHWSCEFSMSSAEFLCSEPSHGSLPSKDRSQALRAASNAAWASLIVPASGQFWSRSTRAWKSLFSAANTPSASRFIPACPLLITPIERHKDRHS